MASPRSIRPGTLGLITRRCEHRSCRLVPSEEINEIYEYCLAYAAEKYGVLVHAACTMSNHHHAAVSDVSGCLPDFARDLHRMTAKAINALQGEEENLWSADSYHFLELPTVDDAIDKIAYIAANPVAAGLVESPEEWPGVMQLPGVGVREKVIRRPKEYFSSHGVYPETVTLRITPLVSERMTSEGVLSEVNRAIAQAVTRAREAVIGEGRRFWGRKKVLAQSFRERATSREAKREVVPIVRSRYQDLVQGILVRYAAFLTRYREALTAWRRGERDIVFPFGTWAMGRLHRALVESAPAPS